MSTLASGRYSSSSGSKSIRSFNSDFSRSSGGSSIRSLKSKNFPLSITHSSATRDEERSKTDDERYYCASFHDSGQAPEKSMLSCTKENDARYYIGSSHYVKQPKQQSNPVCPPLSTSSDEVATHDKAQSDAADDEPTTEDSSQSIDSDESGSVSSAGDEKLTIAYTKHQIISSLMQDVYAMFSSRWQANVRTRTTPEAESSRVLLDHCESNCSKKSRLGKRANYDRDRSQGDGNGGKKQKNTPSDITNCELDAQLACPFHKYNPIKYCPNLDTGVKYRTCLGPGFSSISRLK